MKKRLFWLGLLTIVLTPLSPVMIHPVSAQANPADQVPSVRPTPKESGLDDVSNDPSQLITWICKNQDKAIALEAKEITTWNAVINSDGTWQCDQNIPTIPDGSLSFSCESNDSLNLLSVYWLQGNGDKAQMKSWMNDLANARSMVCTTRKSNQYW